MAEQRSRRRVQRHRAGRDPDLRPDFSSASRTATGGASELVWMPMRTGSPRRASQRGTSCRCGSTCRGMPSSAASCAVDIGRALDAGLEFRALEATVADTLAWARERGDTPGRTGEAPLPPRAGLRREREAELLARLVP